jgi:hypothetical protein
MKSRRSDAKGLISLTEAAAIRGVSHQAISELVRKGRFTTTEISGHIFLTKEEVQSYKPALTGRPRRNKKNHQ